MSRSALTVSMYFSRDLYFVPKALAKEAARLTLTASSALECGTGSGRTGSKYPGTQSSAGVLLPTPRGSKPMTSYCAATAAGSEEATTPASVSPLPPGPPGLTTSGPWCDVVLQAVQATDGRAAAVDCAVVGTLQILPQMADRKGEFLSIDCVPRGA